METCELTEILQNISETERIPHDWMSALIHPLYNKGDLVDVNNCRGISLIPITYKIFSKALLSKTKPKANLTHN